MSIETPDPLEGIKALGRGIVEKMEADFVPEVQEVKAACDNGVDGVLALISKVTAAGGRVLPISGDWIDVEKVDACDDVKQLDELMSLLWAMNQFVHSMREPGSSVNVTNSGLLAFESMDNPVGVEKEGRVVVDIISKVVGVGGQSDFKQPGKCGWPEDRPFCRHFDLGRIDGLERLQSVAEHTRLAIAAADLGWDLSLPVLNQL